MKRNNKGFTYYELLIAITIMTLMVGFATISIGTVSRNNVKRGGDGIESALMQARNNALSKGTKNGFATFYYKDKKLYSYVGEAVDGATFSFSTDSRNWEVVASNIDEFGFSYHVSGGSAGLTCLDGTLIDVQFKQSTGELIGYGTPYTGPGYTDVNDFEIYIEKNNSSSRVIVEKYGNISVK